MSCIPAVVMQKASQGPNSTENANKAEEADITQLTYFLCFASEMSEIQECMAEREGFEPPIAFRLCLISSQVHSTGLCHLSAF